MIHLDKETAASFELLQYGHKDVRALVEGEGLSPSFSVGNIVEVLVPEPRRFVVLKIVLHVGGGWSSELKAMANDWIPEGQTPFSENEFDESLLPVRGVLDEEESETEDETESNILPESNLAELKHGPYTVVAYESSYYNNFRRLDIFQFHCPHCGERGALEVLGEYECECSRLLYITSAEEVEKIMAEPPSKAATPSPGAKKPRGKGNRGQSELEPMRPPQKKEEEENSDLLSSLSSKLDQWRNKFSDSDLDEDDDDED